MNKKIEKLLIDIGRSIPLIIIVCHIFGFIITRDVKHYLLFISGYIINEVIIKYPPIKI